MARASQLENAAAALTGTAALVVLAYRLGSGQPATVALGAAFAVLLVALPAALHLATGLPRLVGTERANRLGVLVRGHCAFDAAGQIRTVVVAGTGTLTSGELGVHAVHVVDGAPHADVLRLAGAVARESGRAVDRAIAAAAPRLPGVSDFDPVADLGARGVVAEVVGAPGEEQRVIAHAVLVGDAELLAAHDIDLPVVAATAGCTPVAVAWDGVARGVLDVGPDVAPARAAAVHRLRALGLRPVLVAAEEAPAAEAVAARAGIAADAVLAGVAPRQAAALVRELGPDVAVIADPERYGAALDVAGLAVHIGCGPTASRPTLTLARGDLPAAVEAIRLARHTAAVIRANLACSLACVAVLLPVTAAGLLGPSLSAAATAAGAAVLAANSLRGSGGPLPAGKVFFRTPQGGRTEGNRMTEAPAPVHRGTRLSRDARRAQLLVAARDVFAAHGYHAAAMDDIAERAGVSKPVLYQHFPGKLELYRALLTTYADELVERVTAAIDGTSDNEQRVHAAVAAYFDFVAGEGQAYRLVFESDLRGEPEAAAVVDGALNRCIDAVAAAVTADAGLDTPRARMLAVGLVGLSQVAAQYWLDSDRSVPRDEAVALMSGFAWRGLAGFPLIHG